MAKSKRRAKLRSAKFARKKGEQAGYVRSDGDPVNMRTKYGKRVMARRRGEPMAARPVAPWWARLTARAMRDTAGTMYDRAER